MKKFLSKVALSAAALACAGAANAGVIDFEHGVNTSYLTFGAPFVTTGDVVTQNGYGIQGLDAYGNFGLVGSLMNGADSNTCLDGKCPLGNTTNFYGSLNDGLVHIGKLDGSAIKLSTFDTAFLAPSTVTLGSGLVAYLAIEGDRLDGSYATAIFPLFGPSATGYTTFESFNVADGSYIGGVGSLTDNVTDLYAYAYYCSAGSCSAFTSNRGQFALDNIAFSVPEPSEWLLMSLGLGALGVSARRRRSV